MRLRWTAMPVAVLALTLTACGSADKDVAAKSTPTATDQTSAASSPSATPSAPTATTAVAVDATTLARRVRAKVTSVTRVITITEDNDPNNKIGRPGGYVSAAVLYDRGASCTSESFGAQCGATVEVWPTAAEAKERADYIQEQLRANPMLGTEYDYLNGPALLRVVGDIKPSVASRYKAAFTG